MLVPEAIIFSLLECLLKSSQEQQAQGHDEHAEDDSEYDGVAVAVAVGEWEEFVDGDIDHNPGDECHKCG